MSYPQKTDWMEEPKWAEFPEHSDYLVFPEGGLRNRLFLKGPRDSGWGCQGNFRSDLLYLAKKVYFCKGKKLTTA